MAPVASALPIIQALGGQDLTTCNAFFSGKHGLSHSF
jgi:hypothetical protein